MHLKNHYLRNSYLSLIIEDIEQHIQRWPDFSQPLETLCLTAEPQVRA
jgi:hypothetical protein